MVITYFLPMLPYVTPFLIILMYRNSLAHTHTHIYLVFHFEYLHHIKPLITIFVLSLISLSYSWPSSADISTVHTQLLPPLKALFTHSFQILALLFLYDFLIHTYLQPSSSYNVGWGHSVIFYMVVIPMLHALIHSLSDSIIKETLGKLFRKLFI